MKKIAVVIAAGLAVLGFTATAYGAQLPATPHSHARMSSVAPYNGTCCVD